MRRCASGRATSWKRYWSRTRIPTTRCRDWSWRAGKRIPLDDAGHRVRVQRRDFRSVTSAVVFAYSEVGARCVRELLAQSIKIPLLFTHADDPNENQWFGSVLKVAQAAGLKVVTPDTPNTKEWIA